MFSRFVSAAAVWALILWLQPAAATMPDPLPYAQHSQYYGAKISPDGRHIATIVRVNGRLTLNVLELPSLKSVGAFGIRFNGDVADFWWATNSRLLYGMAWPYGDNEIPIANGQLLAVNIDGSNYKILMGHGAAWDRDGWSGGSERDWSILDLLPEDPSHVLISRNINGNIPNPVLLDIDTGKMQVLPRGHHHDAEFLTDRKGEIRYQSGTEDDGTEVLEYRDPGGDWKEIGRFAPNNKNQGRMIPLTFDENGRGVYYLDNRGAATMGLYYLIPGQSEPSLIYRDPDRDVVDIVEGSVRGKPIGVMLSGDRSPYVFFNANDPDTQTWQWALQLFGNRDVSITSRSRDRTLASFYAESDQDPGGFYVLDLKHRSGLARLPRASWINPAQMAHKQAISLKARDGLELHGYLTEPVANVVADRKRMVVLVHGGPIGIRDTWDFDPDVQWLAHNGYAVLQINYRGSGGYGADFEKAGYGEWGRKMQDDVTDATRWAIQQGYADANAVCIAGWSYGGYAALMGVEKEPGLYRCAIGMSGLYDLDKWRKHGLASDTPEGRAYIKAAVSDDPETARQLSPAYHADQIQVPVMLVHGGLDPRSPEQQYLEMKHALKKAHKSFTVLFKRDEGHGFYGVDSRSELYRKMIEFLDANTAPLDQVAAPEKRDGT